MAAAIPRPSFVSPDRSWPPQARQPADAGACTNFGLQVVGRLRERAALRMTPSGATAVLEFEIDSGAGYPFLARQVIPGDPAALHAAECKAALLQRGTQVHVYARGGVIRADHGTAAIWLLDVTDVIPCKQET